MPSNKTPTTTAEWIAPNKYDTDFEGFKDEINDLITKVEHFLSTEPEKISEQFVKDAFTLKQKLEDLIAKF